MATEMILSPGDEVYFGEQKIRAIFLGDEGDKELKIRNLVRVIETSIDPDGKYLQWIWVVPVGIIRKDLAK